MDVPKRDGWTPSADKVVQNETDGCMLCGTVPREVHGISVEGMKGELASAASVPAIPATATARLVPTCTPSSPTEKDNRTCHESTARSAARSTDTRHVSQPPPLLAAA